MYPLDSKNSYKWGCKHYHLKYSSDQLVCGLKGGCNSHSLLAISSQTAIHKLKKKSKLPNTCRSIATHAKNYRFTYKIINMINRSIIAWLPNWIRFLKILAPKTWKPPYTTSAMVIGWHHESAKKMWKELELWETIDSRLRTILWCP